jgi:hypothetical protein
MCGKLVAGLKDSSGGFKQFQAFRAAAPELTITVGNEADIARDIAAGCAARKNSTGFRELGIRDRTSLRMPVDGANHSDLDFILRGR